MVMICNCGAEMEYTGKIEYYDKNNDKNKTILKYACYNCKIHSTKLA